MRRNLRTGVLALALAGLLGTASTAAGAVLTTAVVFIGVVTSGLAYPMRDHNPTRRPESQGRSLSKAWLIRRTRPILTHIANAVGLSREFCVGLRGVVPTG